MRKFLVLAVVGTTLLFARDGHWIEIFGEAIW